MRKYEVMQIVGRDTWHKVGWCDRDEVTMRCDNWTTYTLYPSSSKAIKAYGEITCKRCLKMMEKTDGN